MHPAQMRLRCYFYSFLFYFLISSLLLLLFFSAFFLLLFFLNLLFSFMFSKFPVSFMFYFLLYFFLNLLCSLIFRNFPLLLYSLFLFFFRFSLSLIQHYSKVHVVSALFRSNTDNFTFSVESIFTILSFLPFYQEKHPGESSHKFFLNRQICKECTYNIENVYFFHFIASFGIPIGITQVNMQFRKL